MTLRSSSPGPCAAGSGVPHAPQNRKPSGLSCPHLEQLTIPAVYGGPLRPTGTGTIPSIATGSGHLFAAFMHGVREPGLYGQLKAMSPASAPAPW